MMIINVVLKQKTKTEKKNSTKLRVPAAVHFMSLYVFSLALQDRGLLSTNNVS